MRHSRGFTLIELMITIVILAILISLAVPSFNSVIQGNRTLTLNDELSTAIQLARSEALKRRKNVIICRSNAAGNACEDGTDWSNGWQVRQVSGDLIRVWDATPSATVTGPSTGITFQSNGLGKGAGIFEVQVDGCKDSKKRVINVSQTGNATSSQSTCTPS